MFFIRSRIVLYLGVLIHDLLRKIILRPGSLAGLATERLPARVARTPPAKTNAWEWQLSYRPNNITTVHTQYT